MSAMSKTPSNALASNPIDQFRAWFLQAKADSRIELPEAMCLSTLTAKGTPAARMVLMKDFGEEGFSFFTNVNSPKAQQVIKHPVAALTFHWPTQKRQVRIEGKVARLPKRVADDYFATRPRESQLGSWASQQSASLKSRTELMKRVNLYTKLFRDKPVPPPPHWNGFRVVPERIEFWQEGAYRLHDRWVYTKSRHGHWATKLLYP